MKKIIYIVTAAVMLISFTGCEKDKRADGGPVVIKGFAVELSDTEENGVTKAGTPSFSVNTSLDPTYNNISKRGKTGWLLDVSVQFAGSETSDGNTYESTCTYNTTDKMWVPDPQDDIRWPNYTKRRVKATLYPQGWNESMPVITDQSNGDDLFGQDILEQPGATNYNPSHILKIKVQHRYSMLDFIINDADFNDIESVTIETAEGGGTKIYTPYKVGRSDALEYLVILPLGVSNPKVTLKTKEGVIYYETIDIQATQQNICYCADFTGLELLLSAVNIVNWVNGEAQNGYYTTPTGYPTFKGPAGEIVDLIYDTGVTQEILFNSEGERTVKPSGRTIVSVIYKGNDLLAGKNGIVLGSMVIDLNYLFQ